MHRVSVRPRPDAPRTALCTQGCTVPGVPACRACVMGPTLTPPAYPHICPPPFRRPPPTGTGQENETLAMEAGRLRRQVADAQEEAEMLQAQASNAVLLRQELTSEQQVGWYSVDRGVYLPASIMFTGRRVYLYMETHCWAPHTACVAPCLPNRRRETGGLPVHAVSASSVGLIEAWLPVSCRHMQRRAVSCQLPASSSRAAAAATTLRSTMRSGRPRRRRSAGRPRCVDAPGWEFVFFPGTRPTTT